MFNFRRLLALSLALGSASALAAQTPSAIPPTQAGAEKITLPEAIRRALAKNYAIKSSSFDVSVATARVTEQFGIFDPRITGSYDYSDSESPQLVDPSTGLRPAALLTKDDAYSLGLSGLLPWGLTYTFSADSGNRRGTSNSFADNYTSFAGVSGRQPLLRDFGFGATTAQIRIALTNRGISEWQFKQSVIDTLTRVIFAYCDLDYAYAQYRSVARSRDSTAALVAENEKRYKVGQMSEFDVTQARSRLALREEGVLISERQIRDTENILKALISDDRTAKLLDWHIEVAPLPTPPVVLVNAALDFLDALKKRPDYQQAQLALKRNGINYRYQRNQLLPRVDLVGSYGYSGYDTSREISRDLVRNEDYRSYSYGVQVTIPLSFTAERGRYRAAKFQLRQAENDLQRLEQDIVVRVGNAAGQIETARKRVEATRAARELGQQTLDAEVKRLRAGTGSTFFVLQQQELLASLEISEARALSDYNKAIAEYDRQLGTTLEKLNVSLSVPK
jgi:outer membrane protein TolC